MRAELVVELASRASAAVISSSRSRTSSTNSGGRTIRYTIVPTNGNSDAAVAQATSIGSSIRRRASAYVQKISANQTTTSTRRSTLTAVLRLSFVIPKMPK